MCWVVRMSIGDEIIQAIENELVAKLDALMSQYQPVTSDTASQRKEKAAALRSVEKELKAQAKVDIETLKKLTPMKLGDRPFPKATTSA